MSEIVWTAEQVAAIACDRNTMLVASAGTGKTTTVVGKVLWLLGVDYGVDADRRAPLPRCERPCRLDEIAAITFTEKAAYDLKRKLREAIEASSRAEELRWQLDHASVGTIHAFCAALLREHALRFEIDPSFRVLDENEAWAAQDDLIRELVFERLAAGDAGVRGLLRSMRLVGTDFTDGLIDQVRRALRDMRWHHDRYQGWLRDGALDEERLRELAGGWDEADSQSLPAVAALVDLAMVARQRWEARLRSDNERDFDSLVLDVRELLAGPSGAEALASIRRRYRILVVDEFQDTDFAQRDIAFTVGLEAPRPQLFMVGDPKQSIYRFRGADVAAWNEAVQSLAGRGAVLQLSRNFRCAPAIVEGVNGAAGTALSATAEAIGEEEPGSRVDYATLVAGLPEDPDAAIEWIDVEGANAAARRDAAGAALAGRILELVGDPAAWVQDGPERRPCRLRDIAILYRARTGLEHYETALAAAGIAYWQAGSPHLGDRQEVLDIVNVLRLLINPRDDLRAFGFLRSPFVCLRDEVIAGLRLAEPNRPLLEAARNAVGSRWFRAPEHEEIAAIEREALRRGIEAFDSLRRLAPRIPVAELVEELLERTGYRNHLMLGARAEEALANLQSFVHWTEDYRHLDLDGLLAVWDRWSSQDAGVPQAPLYSAADDVVTLSTIHAAKGLEWPAVFLIETETTAFRDVGQSYVTDRRLGPALPGRRDDRGQRDTRLAARHALEEAAESARLLYVSMTRARQRLVVVSSAGADGTHAAWLAASCAASERTRRLEPTLPAHSLAVPTPTVDWLDRFATVPPPASVAPLPLPPLRFVASATELMMRRDDPEGWERRFVHGVAPVAPLMRAAGGRPIPAHTRGTVIHGVLERVREAVEISRILEETIGALDEPGLERALAAGSGLRDEIESEIRAVVESAEWAWYVDGEHERELPFVHLREARSWHVGAFDLLRLPEAHPSPAAQLDLFGAGEETSGMGSAMIVDFKTHRIDATDAPLVAARYALQARIYRQAAMAAGAAHIRFHFTWPNVAVDVDDDGQPIQD